MPESEVRRQRRIQTPPRRKEREGREERKRLEGERSEKNEGSGAMWNAVMGDLIVLWLGITFLLSQFNYIDDDQENWFFTVGVILILRGFILYGQTSN